MNPHQFVLELLLVLKCSQPLGAIVTVCCVFFPNIHFIASNLKALLLEGNAAGVFLACAKDSTATGKSLYVHRN